MDQSEIGGDVFFVLMGAILVFAMHGGFAFLEVGTVRHKNQVNALVKILADFAISTIAYFFVGFAVAYGVTFFVSAATLSGANGGEVFLPQGFTLVKFFFLTTFAAAIPAIISGGIAERMRFQPQCFATVALVGLVYPFFEGTAISGCRAPWRQHWAHHFMISPDRLSFTRSAAGLRSRPSSCWVHALVAMAKPGNRSPLRLRRCRGLPLGPGFCASAGSAST